MTDVRTFLDAHLKSIFEADVAGYHTTTVDDLTLYEWHVTPHRIEGLPFHDFMMAEAGREDSAGIALDPSPGRDASDEEMHIRHDLANYKEQVYGDTAICSYTMLISRGTRSGVRVVSYNESRVMVKFGDSWKVVHVHKSPSWSAPFQPPPVTR
jgi:hypothetical protein